MALKELEGEHEFLRKEARTHRKAVQRLSKDLYQVVSIYALLQGVLFAAVAQTTVFTCAEKWGPVFMALAVTAGTLCAVFDKLWNVKQKKKKVEQSTQRQRDVTDRIDKLRCEGSNVDLDDMDRPPAQAQHTPASGYHEHCFFFVHAFLVLGFLVGFSVLIIVSCVKMLCSGCKCQAGS